MSDNQLTKIAATMRAMLASQPRGYVRRALFGGLQVAMERRDQAWRLAIARIDKAPSAIEARVIARDFALPEGCEWAWTVKTHKRTIPQIGRGGAKTKEIKTKYHVAETTWIEQDPTYE